MKIYSIYRATNKSNSKVYIGFASNFVKRKSAHKKNAERGADIKFYRAIRKYGWENFIFDIIYQSTDKEHTRDIMEPYFISEFDCLVNGYNSTRGGEGAPTVEGESHPMKRPEQRIRQSNSVFGKNNPIHKMTPDKKKEIISGLFTPAAMEKKSGMNHYSTDKRIHRFQHKVTKEIVSMTRFEFSRHYNLISNMVGLVISGKRKSTGGWLYLPPVPVS